MFSASFQKMWRVKGNDTMRSRFCLLMILVSFPSWSADFNKGLPAYTNEEDATAFEEWKPLTEQGDASAQFHLGLLYFNGKGVRQDYK